MADEPSTSKNLISQLARSGRMRIAAALIVTALVGGGLGVIMLRGEGSGKALLFSGLDLDEAADIAGKLDTANIRYELQGGGSAIFVDRAQVLDARMMLAEQGLPTRGSVGYEIFDKTEALGSTAFVQNIQQKRALEGELGRSIAALDMVKAVRVMLVLPERRLFEQASQKPSASVILSLVGNTMSDAKVRAIRNLVASAVPDLELDRITVVDDKGRLLAAGAESDESGFGGALADERKHAEEERLRNKILEIVEDIAGKGAAKVQVSADIDFNRVTASEEKYDPDGRVVQSSQTSEERTMSKDRQPGDETTVANNVPTGAPPANATPLPTSEGDSTRNSETVNYALSKNMRTEIIEGGRIKRLSVAVVVDHARVASADGKPDTYNPRDQAELDRIASLVKSAVGFDQVRGDVVTVENVPFARPDFEMKDAEKPGPFDFDKFDIVRGVEIGALLITALALVLFVLRPLVRGLFSKSPDEIPPELLDQVRAGGALSGPGGEGGMDGVYGPDGARIGTGTRTVTLPDGRTHVIEIPNEDRIDAGIDVARITGQVKASSIKKISEVVQSHPEESLAIIRSWLAEEAQDRAP